MTNNPKKRILDAFLREVYGNKTPPDQTDEILSRLAEEDHSFASDSKIGITLEQDILDFENSDFENESDAFPIVRAEPNRNVPARSFNWLTVAATLLFCAGLTLAIAVIAKRQQAEQNGNNLAKNNTDSERATDENETSNSSDSKRPLSNSLTKSNNKSKQKNSETMDSQLVDSTKRPGANLPKGSSPSTQKPIANLPAFAADVQLDDFTSIKNRIDESMTNNWHVNVIAKPNLVSSKIWMQRLFEKTLGRQPTEADFLQFETYLADGGSRKQIVESITNDEDFAREFSHFWAEKFLLQIAPDSGRSEKKELRQSLRLQLRESFSRKTPLSDIVAELLTASGSSDPNAAEFNAMVSYWGLVGSQPEAVTKRMSSSLLGTEMRCAQCHADSYFAQNQSDFLGFSAFVKGVRVARESSHISVSDVTTKRKNDGLFYEDEKGVAIYAPPKVAGIERRLDRENPRSGLARSIVTSDRFAMSIVNWVWKEIYGYGLVRDGQIGIDTNSPHHQLLRKLAEQLVASDFNFRSAVKWAVMAEAFSAGSQPPRDTLAKDIPKYGGVPFFSYAYERNEYDPRVAMQKLATAYKATQGLTLASRIELAAKESKTDIPTRANPNDPKSKITEVEVIKDRTNDLEFSDENAPDFAKGWGVESRMVAALNGIANSKNLNFDEKLEHLYLFALDRKPLRDEMKRVAEIRKLQSNRYKADPATMPANRNQLIEKKVLQDIWWAIYPR